MRAAAPPYSLEAEESVIGGILVHARCLLDVNPLVKADDFYHPALRAVYESQSDAGKRGAAKRWGAHSDPIASASRPHDGANGGAIATTMANDSSASASASAEEISLSRAGARVERPSDMEMLAAWEAVDLPGSPLLTNVAAEIARTPKNQRPTPMAACEAYKAWVDAMHATRRFPRVSPENMLTNWSYVVDIARGAVKPKDIARGATATSEPGVGTEPTRRDAASRPSETVGYRDDD